MLVLVFATAKECSSALPRLSAPPKQGECVATQVGGQPVLCLVTGIGPLNAAFALGRLVGADGAITGVINLGVAGSFDLQILPHGTITVADTEISPEYGLLTSTGVDPQGLGFAQDPSATPPIFQRVAMHPGKAAKAMGLALPDDWPRAASLTVMGVTGTPERAQALQQQYGAHLENMEGFALALGCAQAGLPLLEVRTVSNQVGSRDKQDWNLAAGLAALPAALEILLPPSSNNGI